MCAWMTTLYIFELEIFFLVEKKLEIEYVICYVYWYQICYLCKKKKKFDNSYYEYTYTDIQALSNSC